MECLPDIQEMCKPLYKIYLPKVGVENIKLPFRLQLRNGRTEKLVSDVSIMTNLEKNKKGISMSRLLISIKDLLYDGLYWDVIKECLDKISQSIGSTNSYIKFDFYLPMIKKSPISEWEFPLYHKCYFEGSKVNDEYSFKQYVKVQYSSYCPCSAALSDVLCISGKDRGFPHAQRSFAEISVDMDLKIRKWIWLEDIIDIVNNNILTQPYPIIKRVDEQELTHIASENPLFVEDAIRIISYHLDNLIGNGIINWFVKCKHEESIHTHEAIAINQSNIEE